MKKLILLFLLFSQIVAAQNITVLKNKKILDTEKEYAFPMLSPDTKKMVYSTPNFNGLYIMDLKSKEIVQISDKQGSGYQPAFSADGTTLYYRWNEYDGLKKYSSLYAKNLNDNQLTIIEEKQRKLSPPQVSTSSLFYTVGKNPKRQMLANNDNPKQEIWVTIEQQKIALYMGDEKRILSPKGEGNYIWPQLSPDKNSILFTFAGHGTFITDLSGEILAELGKLNAPIWLSKDYIIGMKDYDNGYVVTDSDLYAVTSDGKRTIRLTKTDDRIEMYPHCIPGSPKIVYHTRGGDIYLMTVKFE